jgi:hypothetical protein
LRRFLTAILLAALALASGISYAQGRIALLNDPKFPGRGAPSDASYLEKLLTGAGYQVTRISAEDLMSEKMLDVANIDLLVLPQGESYPAKGRDVLFRYLKQGGDFISMGGYAFDKLYYQDASGTWVPRESLYGQFVPAPNSEPVTLFDFEGSLDSWKGGGGTAEMPVAKPGPGHSGGKSMAVCIPNYQNYHGMGSKINASIPEGCGFLSFWAKSDGHTQQMSVECDEKDGSRWIAVAELTPEWKQHIVPMSEFHHWYDGTNRRDELHPGNAKSISFGLAFTHTNRVYEGPHTMWVDDVQALRGAIADPGDDRISARFCDRGQPISGLVSVFDAACPLKWVSQAQANPDQLLIPNGLKLTGDYMGYAAIGMFPDDAARWVPLITGMDRYGRPRGSLGSLAVNYSGDRTGSAWAFFGVDNTDLFSPDNPDMGKAFLALVESMTRGLYLNRTGSDLACYRVGEEAKVSTTVSNFGKSERRVTLWLHILGPDGEVLGGGSMKLTLKPGESTPFTVSWKVRASAPDFCRIQSMLLLDGKPVDTDQSALVVWNDKIMRSGPTLAYEKGRFSLDGAPRLLFGTNETATFWQGLAHNDPLGWDQEVRAMANDGLRVIRSHCAPQFFWPDEKQPNEAQYRKLDAWVQLARKYGIAPYIDVMDWAEGLKDPWLRGEDYLMDPVAQTGQHKYTESFSSRYKDVAGIMYDADNELVDDTRSNPLRIKAWNDWLAKKYGSDEGLAKAWGKYLHGQRLGEVAYEPSEDSWDNRRSFDWRCFHRTNLRDRYFGNYSDAVRKGNPKAIASISGLNIGAMDQFVVTEPLDLADNHFYHSLQLLPSVIKGSDLRPLGIGSTIGEYGVATQPTGRDNSYYMPVDEQITRFLMIGHYLAGCGGTMAVNWDFRDQLSISFPWGVHYAGDLIEKDILHAQNQMVRFFSRIPMKPNVPQVLVCMSDNNRLGGQGGDAMGAAMRCMQVLVDNRVDFAVIHEWKLDKIPAGTRAILFPTPYCISDQTFAQLTRFVRNGGALYFSGDICWSPERRYLGDARLVKLAGVHATDAPNASDIWAPRKIGPSGAKMLEPALAMNKLGKGLVYYSADQIEMGTYSPAEIAKAWRVYGRFLGSAGIKANPLSPKDIRIHCFRQPMPDGGSVYIISNMDPLKGRSVTLSTKAGRVKMDLGVQRQGAVVVNANGGITALEAQGSVALNGKPLVTTSGHFMLTTLDGRDVRQSTEIMILPIGPGRITVHSSAAWTQPIVKLGQARDGSWLTLDEIEPVKSAGALSFSWDEVQAPSMFLLTDRAETSLAVKHAMNPLAQR